MDNKNKVRFSSIASEIVIPLNTTLKSGNIYLWGGDNFYPYKVYEAYKNSPTHKSLTDSKVTAIFGAGIKVENQANLDEYMKFGNKDLNTIVKQIAKDLVLYDAFALKVAKSVDSNYIHIDALDFSGIRFGTDVDDDGNIKSIIYSRDWRNPFLKENRKKIYSLWNKTTDDPCTIFLNMQIPKCGERYPVLPYESAMESILTEHEVQLFTYRNVKNNYYPTLLIKLKAEMSDEDFQLFKENFDRQYKGSNSPNKALVIAGESPETSPEVTPITPVLLDNVYIEQMAQMRENIMVAHQVTNPSVAGLPSQNAFSSGNEIYISYELFNRTVISNLRKQIEDTLNTLFNNSDWNLGKIIIVPTDYNIDNTNNQTNTQEVNTNGNNN